MTRFFTLVVCLGMGLGVGLARERELNHDDGKENKEFFYDSQENLYYSDLEDTVDDAFWVLDPEVKTYQDCRKKDGDWRIDWVYFENTGKEVSRCFLFKWAEEEWTEPVTGELDGEVQQPFLDLNNNVKYMNDGLLLPPVTVIVKCGTIGASVFITVARNWDGNRDSLPQPRPGNQWLDEIKALDSMDVRSKVVKDGDVLNLNMEGKWMLLAVAYKEGMAASKRNFLQLELGQFDPTNEDIIDLFRPEEGSEEVRTHSAVMFHPEVPEFEQDFYSEGFVKSIVALTRMPGTPHSLQEYVDETRVTVLSVQKDRVEFFVTTKNAKDASELSNLLLSPFVNFPLSLALEETGLLTVDSDGKVCAKTSLLVSIDQTATTNYAALTVPKTMIAVGLGSFLLLVLLALLYIRCRLRKVKKMQRQVHADQLNVQAKESDLQKREEELEKSLERLREEENKLHAEKMVLNKEGAKAEKEEMDALQSLEITEMKTLEVLDPEFAQEVAHEQEVFKKEQISDFNTQMDIKEKENPNLGSQLDPTEKQALKDQMIAKIERGEIVQVHVAAVKTDFERAMQHVESDLAAKRRAQMEKLQERRKAKVAQITTTSPEELAKQEQEEDTKLEENTAKEIEDLRAQIPSQEDFEKAEQELKAKHNDKKQALLKRRAAKAKARKDVLAQQSETKRVAAITAKSGAKLKSIFKKIQSVDHKVSKVKKEHARAEEALSQTISAEKSKAREKLLARKKAKQKKQNIAEPSDERHE